MTLFTAYNMRSRGGAGLIWERLVELASRRGITVRYASPTPVNGVPAPAHCTIACPAHPLGNVVYMLGLFLRCLFSWRVAAGDTVVTQGVLYTLPMLPLKWKGARLITLVHGDYFEELCRRKVSKPLRALLRALYEPMYRASDLLMPISADLATRLEKRHAVPSTAIHRVRNSIPEVRTSTPEELAQRRKDLGIHPDSTVLVYAGALNPIKRVDRFVDLVAALSRDRRVQGIIVGDGPERTALEDRARQLSVSSHLIFTGWQQLATPCMELADLLVLCSDYEGCPTVLLEGLALNLPMAGSRVGGIPEILGDDRLTFYPLTPEALHETVLGILEPSGRVAPWVAAHLESRRKRFSVPWEQQVIDAISG